MPSRSSPRDQSDLTPESAPSHATDGRMPETSILRLKEFIRGSSTVAEFAAMLSSQPGELTTFQAYNLMELVLLSDRSINDKNELAQSVGVYVGEKADPLRDFTWQTRSKNTPTFTR